MLNHTDAPTDNSQEGNFGNPSTQQIFVASSSDEILVYSVPIPTISYTEQDLETSLPKLDKANGNDLRRKGEVLEVLKDKKKSSYAMDRGNEKRNRAAKIGFVLSLIAMIGGLIGFAAQHWVVIAFFLIPWIIGFILSAIGLKSEKWKLALMGVIMGVIFFLAWYISTNGFM